MSSSRDSGLPLALPEGFRRQPENVEAEQALLGAILINNEAYHRVSWYLRQEHFYEPVHRRIFAAIARQIDGGRVADFLTLKGQFQEDKALRELDGAGYLDGLARAAETILNAEDYGLEILGKAASRAIIGVLESATKTLYDPTTTDSAELIAQHIAADLEAIVSGTTTAEIVPAVDVFRETLQRSKDGAATIPTGFACLDEGLGGGFRLGGLYGIEGRDKAFKSGFCAGIAEFASIRGSVGCVYISLELSPEDVMQRLGAGYASMGFRSFEREEYLVASRERLVEFDRMLEERREKFFLAHEPGIDLRGLLGVMGQAVGKHGVQLLIVDYWQLVRGAERGQTQASHLENVADSLASFARKNNVVVLMASQLNRDGESLGSDGLRRACSWLGRIQKLDRGSTRWLKVISDRYGPGNDIGSEDDPAFIIRSGPVLREYEARRSAA